MSKDAARRSYLTAGRKRPPCSSALGGPMSVAPTELVIETGPSTPAAVNPRPKGARPTRRRKRARMVTAAVMMTPFAVLLGGLLGWPIVWTFVLSLTNEELTGPTALHH